MTSILETVAERHTTRAVMERIGNLMDAVRAFSPPDIWREPVRRIPTESDFAALTQHIFASDVIP